MDEDGLLDCQTSDKGVHSREGNIKLSQSIKLLSLLLLLSLLPLLLRPSEGPAEAAAAAAAVAAAAADECVTEK